MGHRTTGVVLRLDATRQWSATRNLTEGLYNPGTSPIEVEYALGATEAYALVKAAGASTDRADLLRFAPDTLAITGSGPVGTAPYVYLRCVAEDGVHVSGPLLGWVASNDTLVAPGLLAGWNGGPTLIDVGMARTSKATFPCAYGNMAGGNAAQRPSVTFFVATEHLRLNPEYKSTNYANAVANMVNESGLRISPRTFTWREATLSAFESEVAIASDAFTFIGHAVLAVDQNGFPAPGVGSVGLQMYDRALVKETTPQ